jgi:hypothetical protein
MRDWLALTPTVRRLRGAASFVAYSVSRVMAPTRTVNTQASRSSKPTPLPLPSPPQHRGRQLLSPARIKVVGLNDISSMTSRKRPRGSARRHAPSRSPQPAGLTEHATRCLERASREHFPVPSRCEPESRLARPRHSHPTSPPQYLVKAGAFDARRHFRIAPQPRRGKPS